MLTLSGLILLTLILTSLRPTAVSSLGTTQHARHNSLSSRSRRLQHINISRQNRNDLNHVGNEKTSMTSARVASRVVTLCSYPEYNSENDHDNATDKISAEKEFDQFISDGNLKEASRYLMNNSHQISISKRRFQDIFRSIETLTKEAEENFVSSLNISASSGTFASVVYPPTSPARMEMTEMYRTLNSLQHLQVFGAAITSSNSIPNESFVITNNFTLDVSNQQSSTSMSQSSTQLNVPVQGSKIVTPKLLESITNLPMISLTPKPTNILLIAGSLLAITEILISFSTGIDLNILILTTVFLAFLDKLLVGGAVFETIIRMILPDYGSKIIRHEAGHFLLAYLLGCPVEGTVLSTWAALSDARFGGVSSKNSELRVLPNPVSAGTSFFDPELSRQINGLNSISRASIDRYSIIVMGGIAAEALSFGRADGGAGDEMALVAFLSNLNPQSEKSSSWTRSNGSKSFTNMELIKNQARWGALQAVLLLREYRPCYDALVDALERGGGLGDCIYALENAAKQARLGKRGKPLGYILDKGLYGEFVNSLPNDGGTAVKTPP